MPMQEIGEKSQPALAFAFWSAIIRHLGLVAQSVEQRIENPCVGGSIPPRATKNKFYVQKRHLRVAFLFVALTFQLKPDLPLVPRRHAPL